MQLGSGLPSGSIRGSYVYGLQSGKFNSTPVSIGWVPGHAGVALNEVSDGLAKRGAHGITSFSNCRAQL